MHTGTTYYFHFQFVAGGSSYQLLYVKFSSVTDVLLLSFSVLEWMLYFYNNNDDDGGDNNINKI